MASSKLLLWLVIVAAVAVGMAGAAPLPPYKNWTLPIAERVSDLLSRLTLPEKLTQMSSTVAAVPRLGMPKFNWGTECLHGVRNTNPGGATM